MELNLAPQTLPAVDGNFEQYKGELIKLVDSYKDKPLTEETVAPVKSALRQMRTTLEKMESTAVSAYFDTPKKLLKAKFAELYSIIAEGEGKVDAVIAEDTRRRNEATAERLTNYIKSKIAGMKLEPDVVDYVVLEKSYFNKTAKEIEVLNSIDQTLVQLEKNFASFNRATKKIEKLAKELGPSFDVARFLYGLSKYEDCNDAISSLAEEEAERLITAVPEVAKKQQQVKQAAVSDVVIKTVSVDFTVIDKKKSKGSDDMVYIFTVPKEAKKNFADLIRELKEVGITSKKA